MNLHELVSGVIGTVNPMVSAVCKRSTGYDTLPNGKRVPAYEDVAISVQVQALTYSDITQLDGQAIQGVRRAIYLTGDVMALVRANKRGGDLIVFPPNTLPEGDTWLAAMVLEAWPDWCKVAITLQLDA